jgi:hypothetical protein
MEVRRKVERVPLGDISNDENSSKDMSKMIQLVALEKKKAEALFTTAVTEKEILRLQTIKSLSLLKQENERIRNENNQVMNHSVKMQSDIATLSLDRDNVVLSMHLEREQFAAKLFELERILLDSNDALENQSEEFNRTIIAAQIEMESMRCKMAALEGNSLANEEDWTRGSSSMEALLKDLRSELANQILECKGLEIAKDQELADKILEGIA